MLRYRQPNEGSSIDYLETMEDESRTEPSSELQRLIERVKPMLGAAALEWVTTANPHLQGKAPRELVSTPEDRAQLESYILSLEDVTFL